MFGRANGVLFVFLLFITSFLGAIFILIPFIPLIYFAPVTFRACADRFVGYWLTFPASLIDFVFGSSFYVTGDLIDRSKPAIILMNHRTRLDWLFLWNAIYKMDPWLLTTEKISLKSSLKKIPGAGWAMGCGSFMFLERNLERDRRTIETIVQYYKDTGRPYQLLLFAEGTDRGERALGLSHKFADENGLPRYQETLHPRTAGFTFLLNLMRREGYLAHVYDVTVAYGDSIVSSEMELFKTGVFPERVFFDIQKYDEKEVPTDEVGAGKWLRELWADKEKRLVHFYSLPPVQKRLEPSGERYVWPVETRGMGYFLAFLFWLLTSVMWIYFFYAYFFVKVYISVSIVFYLYALRYHNGVEFLVIDMFYRRYPEKKRKTAD